MIVQQFTKRRSWSPVASVALIWSSMAMLSLLVSIFTSASLPTFVETLISRPLQILAIALVASLSLSFFLRTRMEQQWQEIVSALPIALVGGFVLSFLKIWNDGSGTTALTFPKALTFLFTLGALPTALGPEIILRGTAFSLAVFLAWRAWKNTSTIVSILKTFFLIWIPSALMLLVHTWMALFASVWRVYPVQHSLDAERVLGLVHTNSYWSNFQSDRFFSGVGNQLNVSLALSSSAIVFLLIICFLILTLIRLSPWNRPGVMIALLKRLIGAQLFIFLSPLLIGLWIGLSAVRVNWNVLDVVALIVLVIVFLAWAIAWSFGRDIEDLTKDEREHPDRPLPAGVVRPDELEGFREVLMIIAVVGSVLLGWPVLLVILSLFGVGWISSSAGFGWMQSGRDRILIWAFFAASLVLMGGAFAVRSALMPDKIFPQVLSWGIVVMAIKLTRYFPPDPAKPLKSFIPAALGGLFVAWVLQAPIVLAFLALMLLGLYFLQKNPIKWRTYVLFYLLAFGWVASISSQFN